MSRKLRLSPTSLQRWFEASCPAKWEYEWQWRRIGRDEKFLDVGSDVHEVMAGNGPSGNNLEEVTKFVEKIRGIVADSGITLVGPREQKFTWELNNGVIWSIKIDDFGVLSDGTKVIVDYKTNWGRGWKQTPSGMIPQSLAFQSPAYLMPPPVREIQDWPNSIVYVVSPLWGPGQTFRFDWDMTMEMNLMNSINGVVAAIEAGGYPRIFGKQCLECPFQPKCYGEDGEEKLYVSRFAKTDTGNTGTPDDLPGSEEGSGVQGIGNEADV